MPSIFSTFTNFLKPKPAKKAFTHVEDTISLTFNKTDLTEKKVGEVLMSEEHELPFTDGLSWKFYIYPAGANESFKGALYTLIWVTPKVETVYNYSIGGPAALEHHYYTCSGGWRPQRFESHQALKKRFVNGKLTITCNAKFKITVPLTPMAPRIYQYCDNVPKDFWIVVGEVRLDVHKNFLSLISPIFHSKFVPGTVESESGEIEITDFDLPTVKAAIDYCYGIEPIGVSVDTIVDILRFAEKYNIKSVTNQLEQQYLHFLSLDDFCAIVKYAWEYSRSDLKIACAKFYNQNKEKTTNLTKFFDLSSDIVVPKDRHNHPISRISASKNVACHRCGSMAYMSYLFTPSSVQVSVTVTITFPPPVRHPTNFRVA
uniref:BTB domain-containing protein n=1 Tax=Panagrellus redivivus TaxID=6233 RepID=A0A7E4W961_PANRE